MLRGILSLHLLAAVSVLGEGQAAMDSKQLSPSGAQPLLRIERVQAGEAVCALVQDDGSYRLEKLVRAKGDMYTGTTSPEQIELLRRILGNSELRKISQENIKGDLLTDTLDGLDLAVWRGRGWQTLSFRNSSSRKPFKEEIDPVLNWFQELQKKRPASAKVPGPATRCLPPKELEAQKQQAVEVASDPVERGFETGYLFRFESAEFSRGTLATTCTVVFPDGSYRREKRTQSVSGSKSDRSYRGQVNADSVTVLKELLESPDLNNAVSDTGTQQWAQNIERADLSVPRATGVQRLSFVSEFNTLGNPKNPGGMNNLGYHASSQRVLEPLKRWMNQHTNKQEGATGEDNKVNGCYAAKIE